MTVLLLIATFLTFALIDYLLNRKKAPAIAPEEYGLQTAPVHDYVEGFLVPEDIRYHPGHTWVFQERKGLARIGADEFAAALSGRVDAIDLPKPGQWIRQGQKIITFARNGEKTEMVSPVEGEVAAVNTDLFNHPALLREDPYGRGWLVTVTVPDEESTFRNLVPHGMVRTWMTEAIARMYAMQPLAGSVAADGGRPVHDVLEHVPGSSWSKVTREFFLTA